MMAQIFDHFAVEAAEEKKEAVKTKQDVKGIGIKGPPGMITPESVGSPKMPVTPSQVCDVLVDSIFEEEEEKETKPMFRFLCWFGLHKYRPSDFDDWKINGVLWRCTRCKAV